MGLTSGGDSPTRVRLIIMWGTTIVPGGAEQNFIRNHDIDGIWERGQSSEEWDCSFTQLHVNCNGLNMFLHINYY